MPYLDPLSECTWREHPYERDIIVSDNGRVLSCRTGDQRTHRGYHFKFYDGGDHDV